MTTRSCPDNATLDDFFAARLDPARMDAVEAHLSNCRDCLQELRKRDQAQEEALPLSGIGGNPSQLRIDDSLAALIERLKLAETSQVAATTPPANGSFKTPRQISPGCVRFRPLRSHAKGGLGEVFVAEDGELSREVALKEIQPWLADHPDSRARFIREAEITGGLEHPGIVPVYGLGTYEDGRPYYAMRFIHGEDLRAAIAKFYAAERVSFDSLEFRQLVGRLISVCNAVAYAHSRGVLHRDLKPTNIMLGKFGETLVVDWGLAKVIGGADTAAGEVTLKIGAESNSGNTANGSALGTPAFMSPEQAEGKLDALGPATDIYSLGATLFFLLANRPPVSGHGLEEVLERVKRGEIQWPAETPHPIPPPLQAICNKALARRPEDRYASALDLSRDLESWLADEPVAAYIEPFSVTTRRWMRKHPGLVAGIAASVLVGIFGLTIGSVALGQKNQELSQANGELATANTKLDRANGELKATNHRLELAQQETERKRQEADRQRRLAETRAEETEAVLRFTQQRIFAAARPEGEEGGLGRDVTLRKAVETALPFVEAGFKAQPLIEARLRRTMGYSFLCLGEAQIAKEQCERARQILTELRGQDHLDTLASMNDLANSYLDLGLLEQAVELQEEVLTKTKAQLGPNHVRTLSDMFDLARIYTKLGRHADALPLFEADFADKKTRFGPNAPATLASINGLASCYYNLNRHTEALQLFQEVLTQRKAVLAPDHPDVLRSMVNLANVHEALRQNAAALQLREPALREYQRKFGPEHPETILRMQNLAMTYAALGRLAEAQKLREEALPLCRRKLGPEHPTTVLVMHDLAGSYARSGKAVEALELLEQVAARHKIIFGPDHPTTLRTRSNLVYLYNSLQRFAESVEMLKDLIPRQSAQFGPQDRQTLSSKITLALLLATSPDLSLRDPEQAVKLAREVVEAAPAEPHWNILGIAHYRAQQWKESLAALEKANHVRVGGSNAFFRAMAHQRLGDEVGAKQWLQKGVEWTKSNPAATDDAIRGFRAEAEELIAAR